MIELEEHQEIDPVCPHCETPIQTVWFREIRGLAGKRYVYVCKSCCKGLGMSHRRGFWMG